MDDLKTPKYSSSQVATVLGIVGTEFRVLRNDTLPEHRIPASSGGSQRDARWSALDAGRLAIIAEIPYAMGPVHRRRLFRELSDADLIRAYEAQEPLWLVLTPFAKEITTDPLGCWGDRWGWGERDPWVSGGAAVVNLTQLLLNTFHVLERMRSSPGGGTWRAFLRRGPRGRPRVADASAALLGRSLQEAFNARREEFKTLPRVRNRDLRRRKALDLLAPAVEVLPAGAQRRAVAACLEVLIDQPRVGQAFGKEVAAKVFGCSPRSIASAMRALKP